MFTGIVRERARVLSFEDGRLVVESSFVTAVGDSIAVDGTCLTVVDASDGRLAFDVMAETADRAKPYRTEVNLEPAVDKTAAPDRDGTREGAAERSKAIAPDIAAPIPAARSSACWVPSTLAVRWDSALAVRS